MSRRSPPSPAAEFYSGWQAWAKAFITYYKQETEQQQSEARYALPAHFATSLPSADQAGLLIYITDEDKAALSTATGGWKRLRFAT